MRTPIENVVRIRGFVIQPIESLSLAKERTARCHFIRVVITRSSRRRCGQINEVQRPGGGGGGGTQIWFRRGYAAEAAKPVPIFKGHFGGKGYPLLLCSSWMSSASIWEEIWDLGLNAHFRELQKNTRKKKEPFCEDL